MVNLVIFYIDLFKSINRSNKNKYFTQDKVTYLYQLMSILAY